MIDQLINDHDEIDPDVYDKYIGRTVILDNTANWGRNIETVKYKEILVKKMITDSGRRITYIGHFNPPLNSGKHCVKLGKGIFDPIFTNNI